MAERSRRHPGRRRGGYPEEQRLIEELEALRALHATLGARLGAFERSFSDQIEDLRRDLSAMSKKAESTLHRLRHLTRHGAGMRRTTNPPGTVDLDDKGRLVLGNDPLAFDYGDGRSRWLTVSNTGGLLLVELVVEGRVRSLKGKDLTRAIQQVRSAPLLGRGALVGRGRDVMLGRTLEAGAHLRRWWDFRSTQHKQ